MSVKRAGSVFAALAVAAVVWLPPALTDPTASAVTTQEGGALRMALTFDDLPYVDARRSGNLAHARAATAHILRALTSHRAPAVGFVNESKLHAKGEVDARTALLRQWFAAGATLGNHTYSHADLNALTVEQFQDEVVRGEAVTRKLTARRTPYQLYFRHPYTHTGDTNAKKETIAKFLEDRGYRIAPHTIDSSDYIFDAAYVRALDAGAEETARRLRTAYLDFVIAATAFAERITPEIFGRAIPQVVLLHANDVNADALDELLRRLEGRGYRFITLDEAFSDAAYATRDTFVTTFGPTWLWRWSRSLDLDISFEGDPEPAAWVMDLYAASREGAR